MAFSKFNNIYIHVPFCDGKCSYCAFYSEPSYDPLRARLWLESVARGLERSEFRIEEVKTLYIGGGTPTCLGIQEMRALFDILKTRVPFADDPEISMECNPGSLDEEKANLMASFVNRVSVGAQAFDEELLATLGRRGSNGFRSVERAFELLRAAGIQNLGLDLIYAIPGESADGWRQELELALKLKPKHLSAYSLTIEEGTRLANSRLNVPDDDDSAEMWDLAGEILGMDGLLRYEVSNYAAEGFQCRHNQAVWHGENYLGLGPSASSFDGSKRWTEASPIDLWLAGADPEHDELPPQARARELFVMGLRTVRGWKAKEFKDASGMDWGFAEAKLGVLHDEGLLEIGEDFVKPTPKGLVFWNSMAEELI